MSSPLIICGPCSAESQQQVLTTAQHLIKMQVPVLRAGVWKPRTTPGHFEGYGEQALQWLVKAREQTGICIATEVALPEHVTMCRQYDVDMVWIGARTTAAPFAVQQLANAMRGYDKPVMVKNPINPDLNLWLGAVERLQQAGVNVVAAIHRGFSVNGDTHYRYPPLWQIATAFRQAMPQLLMLGDPSHMAGRQRLVGTITQQFVKRHYDGVMIECHPQPATALTDAQQQLSFRQLNTLLQTLKAGTGDTSGTQLELLRQRIDDIDDRLLTLLQERMQTVEQLGHYKAAHSMPIAQPERFQAMLKQRYNWCCTHGMQRQFVRQLFQLIQEESIRRQQLLNADTVSDKHPEKQ